jgi:hypothetical protein
MTESKVTRWLNDHPAAAVGYCADHFPPDTTTQIVKDTIDTKAYEAAYKGVSNYADSLFNQLKRQRETFNPTLQQPCPPAVNLDSLRKVVDFEIRKRLTPCVDSIEKVVYTVVDKAREKQLQGKIDEKDITISARDKRISELEAQVKGLKKWPWLFWAVIAGAGLYTLFKFRSKLGI